MIKLSSLVILHLNILGNDLNLFKDLKAVDQKSGETWRAVDARTRTPRWPAGLLQVIVMMVVMEQRLSSS